MGAGLEGGLGRVRWGGCAAQVQCDHQRGARLPASSAVPDRAGQLLPKPGLLGSTDHPEPLSKV